MCNEVVNSANADARVSGLVRARDKTTVRLCCWRRSGHDDVSIEKEARRAKEAIRRRRRRRRWHAACDVVGHAVARDVHACRRRESHDTIHVVHEIIVKINMRADRRILDDVGATDKDYTIEKRMLCE